MIAGCVVGNKPKLPGSYETSADGFWQLTHLKWVLAEVDGVSPVLPQYREVGPKCQL
jgi:hypothetical protein